jgi:hypothetical protein
MSGHSLILGRITNRGERDLWPPREPDEFRRCRESYCVGPARSQVGCRAEPAEHALRHVRGGLACHRFACTTSPSRWTGSGPARDGASTRRLGTPEVDCWNGSSPPGPSTRCMTSLAGIQASTKPLPATGGRASVRRSWAGASSGPSAAHGPTMSGRGGGATTRCFTRRCSCSPITADPRSRWRVVVPIVLGRGERLWDGLEGLEQRFKVESVSAPSSVTHLTFTRR